MAKQFFIAYIEHIVKRIQIQEFPQKMMSDALCGLQKKVLLLLMAGPCLFQ